MIPWLEEVKRAAQPMPYVLTASISFERLQALCAIAEAAQELITDDTPDGPDEWRVYKAVQAAERVE